MDVLIREVALCTLLPQVCAAYRNYAKGTGVGENLE